MKRLQSGVIASILAGVLLAGCTEELDSDWPPDWPPPNPDADEFPFDPFVREWGLGLNKSALWPAPREYQEPALEIETFSEWLDDEGTRILAECGSHQTIDEFTASDGYLNAIGWLPHACSTSIFDEGRRLAQEAREASNEEAIYESLFRIAERAISRQDMAWQNFSLPGTVTDLEVASELWNHRQTVRDFLESSKMTWDGWHKVVSRNGSNRDRDLVLTNALLGPLAIPLEVDTWLMILQRYPWSEGQCLLPEIHDYSDRINATLERGLVLGRQFEYGPHQSSMSVPYGRLNGTYSRQWEFALEQQDWIGALRVSVLISWKTAYYENFTRPALPTPEEAHFLVAEYRNQTRTLLTELESNLHDRINRTSSVGLWFYQPALLAMTLPALEWAFKDVHCTSARETLG